MAFPCQYPNSSQIPANQHSELPSSSERPMLCSPTSYPKNYHYSSALADLQKNSGVLSEGFALGNLGPGLWQPRSAISVRLLSGEEDSSDFPARIEALHPHCVTTSSLTKVNKARGASVTKEGMVVPLDNCDSCVTTQSSE